MFKNDFPNLYNFVKKIFECNSDIYLGQVLTDFQSLGVYSTELEHGKSPAGLKIAKKVMVLLQNCKVEITSFLELKVA